MVLVVLYPKFVYRSALNMAETFLIAAVVELMGFAIFKDQVWLIYPSIFLAAYIY